MGGYSETRQMKAGKGVRERGEWEISLPPVFIRCRATGATKGRPARLTGRQGAHRMAGLHGDEDSSSRIHPEGETMLEGVPPEGLTFDDVLLVPARSGVLPAEADT